MSKLIHKNKVILNEMKYLDTIFGLASGLMFSGKKKIKNGVCLKMPVKKDSTFSCAVTMHFVFFPLEIIFVNSKMKVVDKVILKPWKTSYVPKAPCKYIIESKVGTFKDIKLNDSVKIEI